MKKIQLVMLGLLLLLLVSCNNEKGLSDAYGNFESVPVLVAAQGQGQLISFTVMEGEKLHAGQQAGAIDTVQLYLKKEQLKASVLAIDTRIHTVAAQVRSQQVQLQNLEREYARILALARDGAATEKQKDDMEGNISLARAQMEVLETQKASINAEKRALQVQISQLTDQISKSIITNPLEGVVLQKYKQQGEIVAPGQTLYKIAELDTLILRAYISGKQLSQVTIGKEVTVRFDEHNGIGEMQGKVTWIASEAEFTPKIIQTRDERVNLVYALKIKVPNDGRLKIGMPGEVKF